MPGTKGFDETRCFGRFCWTDRLLGSLQSDYGCERQQADVQPGGLSKQAQVEWDRQVVDSFPGEAEGLLHDLSLNLTENFRFFCVLDEER